ncbi:MAG: hypothetical protein ICV68_16510 [Pyrinomonadaceae bacterium]|nr:hypothetical protein [Pyrinomonadaceae bacterium]
MTYSRCLPNGSTGPDDENEVILVQGFYVAALLPDSPLLMQGLARLQVSKVEQD